MNPETFSNRCTQIVLCGQKEIVECSEFVHLNYGTYIQAEERMVSDSRRKFLSLGDTIAEWHSSTLDYALKLEAEVRQNVKQSLMYMGRRLEDREFQILYGHLLRAVCARVSRTATQMAMLPESGTFVISDSITVSKHNRYPRNSAEAYEYLSSGLVSSKIEAELARILLRLDSVAAEVTPTVKLPQVKLTLTQSVYLAVARILRGAVKRSQIFISSSYLGRWRETLLQVSLLQPPFLSEFRPFDQTSTEEFKPRPHGVGGSQPETIQEFTSQLFWSLIPLSLLENAPSAILDCQEMGWPERPSVIFTSNDFDTNDLFKVYLVHHLQNVEYLVGQHGNGYGVSHLDEHNPEVLTPDIFLSWGWEGNSVLPLGVFTPRLRSNSKKPKGALLVLRDSERFSFSHDEYWTTEQYLSRITDLVIELGSLEVPITIKLHSSSPLRMVQWARDLSASSPHVSLAGKRKFKRLLRSRLLPVFTYDSTGILELGTSGGRFFFFASEGTHHVRPEFAPNYHALESSGLLCSDPREAANMIFRLISRGVSEKKFKVSVIEFLSGIAMRPRLLVFSLRRFLLDIRDGKSRH